jgi:hypothetical protein
VRRGIAGLTLLVVGLLLWMWWSDAAGTGKTAAGKRGGRRPGLAGGPSAGGSFGVGSRPEADRSGVGKVRGRIVDTEGMPVTEGRVILHCLPSGGSHSFPIDAGVVEVGEEGEFVGPGCRGTVCAEFRHTHLLPREPWVFEPNREAETVTARPLERITGTVVDPQGQPVAGARLMVRRGRDDDPTALPPFTASSTVSDAEGVFNFARVERPPCDPCGEASGRCEPGDTIEVPAYNALVLVARAPGFRGVERAVELGEEDWTVTMEAPLEPLTGTVLDADGQAYPRARVLARSHVRGYEVHQAVVKDGAFALRELGDGGYDLRVLQDGVTLASASEVEAGTQVALVGDRPASGPALVVEVMRESDGAAVAGALVDGGPFVGAKTDEDGAVRAEAVAPGRYALVIRAPGSGTQRRELEVPAGPAEDGAIVRRVDIVYNAP